MILESIVTTTNVDNVELFARAAVNKIETTDLPTLSKAEKIDGHIIQSACRAYEFEVESIDESGPRMSLICATFLVSIEPNMRLLKQPFWQPVSIFCRPKKFKNSFNG